MSEKSLRKAWRKMCKALRKTKKLYWWISLTSSEIKDGYTKIILASIIDYEAKIKQAQLRLNDEDDILKSAQIQSENISKYIDSYREWAKTDSEQGDKWVELVRAYDSGNLLKYCTERYVRKARIDVLNRLQHYRDCAGSIAERKHKAYKTYHNISTSEPVKAFLKDTGSTCRLSIEDKSDMQNWYIVFCFPKENS